jgi:hypothetical protein
MLPWGSATSDCCEPPWYLLRPEHPVGSKRGQPRMSQDCRAPSCSHPTTSARLGQSHKVRCWSEPRPCPSSSDCSSGHSQTCRLSRAGRRCSSSLVESRYPHTSSTLRTTRATSDKIGCSPCPRPPCSRSIANAGSFSSPRTSCKWCVAPAERCRPPGPTLPAAGGSEQPHAASVRPAPQGPAPAVPKMHRGVSHAQPLQRSEAPHVQM